jgi:exodeoxyribonuclease VII small subunit
MPTSRAKSSSKQSFEELYQQLEEKVSLLEAGGLSLDDSLAAYEDAVTFAQRCQQLLDRAELRITRLRASMDGGSASEDEEPVFEPDEEDLEDEEEEDGA